VVLASKRKIKVIDDKLAASLLPSRQPGAHKWSVGGLVIVGGAPGYVGAPALCARAAMRAGAGIVTIAVARSSVGPIAGIVPEATFVPLPEGDASSAATRAVSTLAERVERSKALVVGPGLSDDEHAQALLSALFGFSSRSRGGSFGFGAASTTNGDSAGRHLVGGDRPTVVDADGLNWLAGQEEWWTRVEPGSLILTPHAGEMARLLGISAEDVADDAEKVAIDAAATWKQVVLLKGAMAVLTDGDRTLSGGETPVSLATAGTGDVLAGTIGAFLAQGLSLLDAGTLAINVGSRAARQIEAEFGTRGLIASDLPDAIGRELAALVRSTT